MKDSLYPYGRAGADFASDLPPELIVVALVMLIAMGVYFVAKI